MLLAGAATRGSAQVITADHDQQAEACAGVFYDSGGAAGDYGSNEDVTVTICPTGGAGAGPATKVRFITWSVAAGAPGDSLIVYDGTGTGGTPLAIGKASSSLAGLTFVSADPSGCLTFVWRSDGTGTAAGWLARIVTTPWPGSNGSVTVCSNGPTDNLFTYLGDAPDPGGAWTGPGGAAHSGTLNPATDPAGTYTYAHAGVPPCTGTSATVTVTKVQAPKAGTNGTATFCATSASAPLINFLGGTPDPGGSWTGPGGAHSGTFNPASDAPGTYTYTVAGSPPCGPASATVVVTVNPPANAGTSGSTSVCSNDAAFGLFGLLGGTPQPTGSWTGPGGAPVSGTYTPGTSAPGTYTYTVPGIPPCPAAISTVTVLQTTAPNAGQPRSITVCSDDTPFSMRSRLNGTPDAGGTWVGPNGPCGDQFTPASDPGGLYTYTVAGTGPCADASATLTIIVRQRPDAGINGSITLCSTDGVYNLFNALGGTPQVGGSWRDPLNNAHSGSFTPGVSVPGTYIYTVTGQAPCAPSSATVTVSVNTAPKAGTGTTITRCADDAPFSLFSLLTGNPDAGGTWSGPGGAHSGTFDPGSDAPGAYIYTVAGLPPCADATATVHVAVNPAPDAGASASVAACASDAPFSLFAALGGTPDPGGTWTGPGGSSDGTFNPATGTPGTYTYTVTGLAPCQPATATVTVSVTAPPDPGTNGSITVCSSDGPVDLFTLLGGSPQVGGAWTAPGGATHNGTYLPGSQAGGNYTYTVPGTGPCGPRSAVVQVNRVIAPNAGTNGTITVCSTNAPFDLQGVLGGSPSGSGSWLDPAMQPITGTFTPGVSAPGTYAYVVQATAPCVNDTGFVTVNVNQAPDAGSNRSIIVCSSAAPFQLLDSLGGSPQAGGTWTRPNGTPHSGTFTPGTSQQGGYTYTVPGLTPCLAATAVVTVSVTQAPRAGTGGNLTRCSNEGIVNLFGQLSGDPDNGGAWTGPNGPHTGFLDPASDPSGAYVYTVPGTAPCGPASATINATINPAPNAGGDGSVTVCQGTATVDLSTVLVAPFDAGGTWSDETLPPTGQLSNGFFNCAALPPGTYLFKYEVAGIGSCAADAAYAQVVIVGLLDAGTSGTLPACSSNSQVNLFNGLGGSPQTGGQWIDLSGTGALSGQYFNATLVPAPGTYQFRYRLTGSMSCASDSATVTVNVVPAQNPGCNGTASFCSTDNTIYSLINYLGCSPQTGGQWRRGSPSGPVFSGTYNPLNDDPGTFYYVFNQGPPCAQVHAKVTVTEVNGPVAGTSASRQVCSSDAPFSMTAALGGAPDPGGQWYFSNVPHGSTFVPGLDAQGVYEYRVAGAPPCAQAVAFLTVSVTTRANAGCSSTVSTCSNAAPFLLFASLTCSPDNNGTWLAPGLVPHPSGIFTPGTSAPGDYLYIVAGASPCANDTAVVSVFVNDAPNAGCPGNAALCASPSAPAVNLLGYLGCTPDPTGTWTGPAPSNPPFNGFFTPGVSAPGTYTYSVTNGCGTATSTVSVSVSQPSNAGCSASTQKCSTDGPFNMLPLLGCSPAPTGQWSGPLPSTAPVSGIFSPGTSTPGSYVYTVPGQGACPAATATLTVGVTPWREAGSNASLPVCRSSGAVALFPLLGPTAQPGGQWFFNSTTPHSGTLQPSVAQSGNYVYRHAANGPCAADSAIVSVTIHDPPNAGCDGLVEICSTATPVVLFSALSCSLQAGGIWFRPDGQQHSGIYNPAVDEGGIYKYRVPGNPGCGPDSAYVTVLEYEAVDAGGSNQVQVCSNGPQFNLFGLLLGSPQPGGTWYSPSGAVVSGVYIPGTSEPGAYKYKLVGTAPCASDSALVTVFQSTEPNAGVGTNAALCSSQGIVPLMSLLGGSPDQNGTWTPSAFINTATDPSAVYTYTVAGQPPCASASASVVVSITQQAWAGTSGAITACEGADAIALVTGLGGTVAPGGLWSTDCTSGTISGGVYDASGLSAGDDCSFTYLHPANGPCPADSATVALSIVDALYAGADSAVEACRGEVLSLFDRLGGDPQPGGAWLNVDGAPGFIVAGVFNSGQVDAGTTWRFDYVLPSLPQCLGDTARLTVTVLDGPFAGNNGFLSLCSNSAPINLGSGLSGGPDAGGQWYNQNWAPVPALFQASNGSGSYYYVVTGSGICPADTAMVSVTVTPAPNAGQNAPLAICSNGAPVNLFSVLGGNPQPGGTWQYTSVVPPVTHSAIYNPAVDAPGNYVYTVQGTIPCPAASAIVVVTEPQAPNPGCSAATTFCSNQAPQLMRNFLGCSPASTGTWVYVTGGDIAHGEYFDPATDPPGQYRYTVAGTSPCADLSAVLTISVNPATDAGQSTTLNACLSQTEVDLFAALGPNAQAGGSWTDVNGSGALNGSTFNPAAAGNGSWPFIYAVLGTAPCTTSTATITVAVGVGGTAGSDSSVTVCGGLTALDLFTVLAGAPQPGGTWQDAAGTGAMTPAGILNPSLLPVGGTYAFSYTNNDPGCGTMTAVVTVTTAPYPVAGTDAVLTTCADGSAVALFGLLGGSPDAGGSWFGPGGAPHAGTLDPATDPSGSYTYVVAGTPPCADASATVSVTVNLPPDAGMNGELLACDTVTALDLFAGLQGTPQPGGAWQDLDGSGGLSGGMLNTTGIAPGEYHYGYTVAVAGCAPASAMVKVKVVGGVDVEGVAADCNARDRTYQVSFTITGGDPATYEVEGLEGAISPSAPYVFTSEPIFTHLAYEAFVRDGYACSEVRVAGTTPCGFSSAIFMPESFSPNGDGVNDRLIIPGIEGYPGNRISIFNRWGAVLYEAAGYDNRSVAWDGSTKQGQAPTGTYYYVLDLGTGKEALTGFIYLNR